MPISPEKQRGNEPAGWRGGDTVPWPLSIQRLLTQYWGGKGPNDEMLPMWWVYGDRTIQ